MKKAQQDEYARLRAAWTQAIEAMQRLAEDITSAGDGQRTQDELAAYSEHLIAHVLLADDRLQPKEFEFLRIWHPQEERLEDRWHDLHQLRRAEADFLHRLPRFLSRAITRDIASGTRVASTIAFNIERLCHILETADKRISRGEANLVSSYLAYLTYELSAAGVQ